MANRFEHNSIVARGEPKWAAVDLAQLPGMAFASGTAATMDLAFPHHWVRGDSLFLHRQGLARAWALAMGAESGKRADAATLAHLRKHFAAIGIKKAQWDGREYDVTLFDSELRLAGLVTATELQVDPGAYAIRILGGQD